MFGPQLEPPPPPPPAEMTTFERQYAPDVRATTEGGAGDANDSRLSFALNITLTSDYYFRGIAQRNDRPSVQPGAEAAYRVCERESTALSVYAGLWGDIRVNDLGGESLAQRFYELDVYAGAELTYKRLATRVTFTEYLSPTGDFARVHELSFAASFDDSGLYGESLEKFSIHPAALVAFEIGPDGADGGPHAGVFLSLGVEPTIDLGRTPVGNLTLSAPVELGLSLGDYYETPTGDETFGYLSAGVRLTLEPGGAWPAMTLGADYVELGPGGEAFAGRGSELTLSMDMAWAF